MPSQSESMFYFRPKWSTFIPFFRPKPHINQTIPFRAGHAIQGSTPTPNSHPGCQRTFEISKRWIFKSKWTEKIFQQQKNSPTLVLSTVGYDGGAGSDIRHRLNKARNAFRILNKVSNSSQYSTKTKPTLYHRQSFPPYCTAQNAGGWLTATSTNCLPSTLRTLEESCE